MNPKEKLRKSVVEKIEDLPVACKEDFYSLIALLTRYNELDSDRQQQYQNWISSLFQKNQAQAVCSFCGQAMPPPANGDPQYFCSEECKNQWKRNILLVLAAYM